MADQVTFRDFAGALMQGDNEAARGVLATLLALEPPAAAAATEHFRTQMAADPGFMMKAMGMRSAVEARDGAQLEGLLRDCFGLGPAEAAASARAVLAR
ncbi:MAG TPA: hypothetical protein VFS43_23585 [Polyangiaceae bacterium]|nr:hypothetical protein [Polyangiaceae bacterium]